MPAVSGRLLAALAALCAAPVASGALAASGGNSRPELVYDAHVQSLYVVPSRSTTPLLAKASQRMDNFASSLPDPQVQLAKASQGVGNLVSLLPKASQGVSDLASSVPEGLRPLLYSAPLDAVVAWQLLSRLRQQRSTYDLGRNKVEDAAVEVGLDAGATGQEESDTGNTEQAETETDSAVQEAQDELARPLPTVHLASITALVVIGSALAARQVARRRGARKARAVLPASAAVQPTQVALEVAIDAGQQLHEAMMAERAASKELQAALEAALPVPAVASAVAARPPVPPLNLTSLNSAAKAQVQSIESVLREVSETASSTGRKRRGADNFSRRTTPSWVESARATLRSHSTSSSEQDRLPAEEDDENDRKVSVKERVQRFESIVSGVARFESIVSGVASGNAMGATSSMGATASNASQQKRRHWRKACEFYNIGAGEFEEYNVYSVDSEPELTDEEEEPTVFTDRQPRRPNTARGGQATASSPSQRPLTVR